MLRKIQILFLFVFGSCALGSQVSEDLVLQVGESVRIQSPPYAETWLSKSGVIVVSDQGSFLFLQARKLGEVLLRTGQKFYKIHVVSSEEKSHYEALQELLKNRQGLKIGFANTYIQVTGHLYRFKDFKDISVLAQKRDFFYQFLAEVSDPLKAPIESYIQESMKDFLKSSSFSVLWEKPLKILIPQHHPLTEDQKNIFKHYGSQISLDPSLFYKSPLIELKLLLVESTLNNSLNTHFPWGNSEEGSFLSRILEGKFFQNWLKEFRALENRGEAHILSQAVLLSESGKSSRFLSGGEVAVPHYHPEKETQTIRWKPYGIQLNFKTRVDRKQNIHMELQAEISEIDHSHSGRAAPSLKTNRISSSVTLRSGQTLSLSSLIRRQRGKSQSAPLIVSRTPLLGEVFSLKGKLIDNTRLNIFVTAKVL